MATDYKFRITAKDQTKGAFNSVNKSVNSTQTAMKKLAGAFAGVFAVRQIVQFGNEALALADNIGKTADALKISTDFLQKYQFAAGQSGISTEEFNKSLMVFSKLVGQAQIRTTEAGRTLERFGVSVKDANGESKAVETVFLELMKALDGVENAFERNAILADVFGRAGLKLSVLMQGGSQAMQDLAESADGLIPEETIRKAEAFNDTMTRLKRQVLEPLQTAFINTAKAILDFAEAIGLVQPDLFTKSLDELNSMLDVQNEKLEKNQKLFERFGAYEYERRIQQAEEEIKILTEAITKRIKANEIQNKLNNSLDAGAESADNFSTSFNDVLDDNVTVVKTFAETVEGQLTNAFTDFFDFANKEFLDFKNLATNVAQAVINELIQIFIVKKLVGMVQGSITSFTDSFKTGGTGGISAAESAYNTLNTGAATQVQTASPTVNFNISTVDAQGFDQLLTSRKGTITTIINDAMNNQGKMGII